MKGILMTEDSPTQKQRRKEVKDAKVKQSEKVNRLRRKKASNHSRKDPLEIGDICTSLTGFLAGTCVPHPTLSRTTSLWYKSVLSPTSYVR
jgi:hypothetical protein